MSIPDKGKRPCLAIRYFFILTTITFTGIVGGKCATSMEQKAYNKNEK